jgi:hypothetical protein
LRSRASCLTLTLTLALALALALTLTLTLTLSLTPTRGVAQGAEGSDVDGAPRVADDAAGAYHSDYTIPTILTLAYLLYHGAPRVADDAAGAHPFVRTPGVYHAYT